MSPKARAALTGFARGLGAVLGPITLFCLMPIGWCVGTCVPRERLCDEAGGSYGEIAHVGFCEMPGEASECPPGFTPGLPGGSDCVGGLLPAACVFPWQR